ncbi:MAG TPA: molybdate ABC transporter permease subunit [Acidobacteriaceae bacterium]
MDTQALWLTLRLALSTTAILLLIAIPLARWIAAGTGAARALAQAVVALPLVLPPTVIGFYLLVALGPLTAPGRLIIRLLGHPLAFSFSGLVVGSVLYSLPFAVQPLVAGFRAVDPALLEVAATLGASPARAFRTITLPLAKPSLVAAAVLTFTHTVGEFGVVLMLGGNIPGATRTLSIALYDQVQDFNYAAANRTAGVLLAFSLLTLVVVYWRGVGRRSILVG